jgi:hypothetical protein
MNKQQTAVQWFYQQIIFKQNGVGDSRSWDEIYEQANAKFEQQIKDAFEKGGLDGWNLTSAEYYYNETFKTKP